MSPPILLTPRLILIPTPLVISLSSYVDFYRGLLSDARVTGMGWKDDNPQLVSEDECLKILKHKNDTTWAVRGFGDFAAAELPEALTARAPSANVGFVELAEPPSGVDLHSLRWVGYGCIRDASAVILQAREKYLQTHDAFPEGVYSSALPPWQEMVEIKYGFAPSEWGKGLASEVANSLHTWGIERWGVRRFIGATAHTNAGSRRVLQKSGYVANPARLWVQYLDEDEWVYAVPQKI